MNMHKYADAPRCGRRSRSSGRWAYCSVTRPRTRSGYYLPACLRHLTLDERAAFDLLPGAAERPRKHHQHEIFDVAKLRAGDRD